MDDGKLIDVKAHSAADAIQIALTEHIGHKVIACHHGEPGGLYGGVMRYEVPPHSALMAAPTKRIMEPKVRDEETEENRIMREKKADWIETWLTSRPPLT